MRAGLVDRVRLEVLPVILGARRETIFDGYDTTELKLVEGATLDSRVVGLDYQPVTNKGEA
jgi:riboflavin biosynthesis pyrimidine reductase